MEKYLVKIAFDCNDSDYVYGLTVVDKDEKKIIDRNLSKSVSFGSYDFGGNECALRDCISIKQITEDEFNVLEKLNLLNFGEGNNFNINYLDGKSDYDSDDDN